MKINMVGSGVVSIPPRKGGATELIIYEISKYLAEKHDVTVFDLKEKSNKKEETVGNARYQRLWVPRPNNIFLLRGSEFVFGLRSFFRSLGKDVSIVHCQTVFSALPFAILKPFLKAKMVYTSHNPAWTDERNSIFNSAILKIEGAVIRKSDAVITVSNTMKEEIIKKTGVDPRKINVVYNFVDTKKFSPKNKTWKIRKHTKGPIVLFVSKLSRNKGVECFLRSVPLVKEKIKDVKFILVGPVNFEQDSKNTWKDLSSSLKIDDSVIFYGPATDDELPSIYSSCDIFSFPTLKEAFGIVIIEAMASGLPVVTTDLPVTREVTGGNAVFVEKENFADLARAVVSLLSDKKRLKKLKSQSIKRSKRFEKLSILRNYENIYVETIHKEKK